LAYLYMSALHPLHRTSTVRSGIRFRGAAGSDSTRLEWKDEQAPTRAIVGTNAHLPCILVLKGAGSGVADVSMRHDTAPAGTLRASKAVASARRCFWPPGPRMGVQRITTLIRLA
jgi:hypothetical protein